MYLRNRFVFALLKYLEVVPFLGRWQMITDASGTVHNVDIF